MSKAQAHWSMIIEKCTQMGTRACSKERKVQKFRGKWLIIPATLVSKYLLAFYPVPHVFYDR